MENSECSICHCEFDTPHTLECGHKYCSKCIINWFRSGKSDCPYCRAPPPLETEFEKRNRIINEVKDFISDDLKEKMPEMLEDINNKRATFSKYKVEYNNYLDDIQDRFHKIKDVYMKGELKKLYSTDLHKKYVKAYLDFKNTRETLIKNYKDPLFQYLNCKDDQEFNNHYLTYGGHNYDTLVKDILPGAYMNSGFHIQGFVDLRQY